MRTKIILACTECKQRNYFITKEKKSGLRSFIAGLETEYKKIVFPTKQDVIKESIATIAISVLIGALITGLDIAMKWGLGFVLVK